MNTTLWGKTPEGEEIFTYTLKNSQGMTAKFMNYGANLLELWVPDADGELADVVLGYEKLEDYFGNEPNFGCTVGRNANRIGDSVFHLNGKEYKLDVNDGKNNLHSGFHPLHHRIWNAVADDNNNQIIFTISSPDGDMGFPGAMEITVTYTLEEDNSLRIDYRAVSDTATVFNPTNHTYFNLSGHNSGSVLSQVLQLDSDYFTWASRDSIPDGTIIPVDGTPMDFRIPKTLGRDIELDYEQLVWAGGYDHNWILNTNPDELTQVGSLMDPKSGRVMTFYTDLPGIQVYTGNYIKDTEVGKGSYNYTMRDGVCFETQYFPNAVNVPSFAQPITTPGIPMTSTTIYQFTTL